MNPEARPRPATTDDMRHQRRSVATIAGDFFVGTWHGSSRPVLALHGVSSNHLLWRWAAEADPQVHLVAPDLRGRGGSTREGPYGLARHRDDMLAVMDALGLERVVLAGMSMGGFVATAMAAAAPERFDALVLVDGGLPFDLPDGAASALAEVSDRGATAVTFPSVEAYLETYFATLGNGLDRHDPVLGDFLAWNLEPAAGGLTVRLPDQALAQDSADVFGRAPVAAWLEELTMPVHLVHALPGALPIDVDGWLARLPNLTAQGIDDVDHATIVMGQDGGRRVAGALRHVLGLDPAGLPST